MRRLGWLYEFQHVCCTRDSALNLTRNSADTRSIGSGPGKGLTPDRALVTVRAAADSRGSRDAEPLPEVGAR